MKHYKIRAYIPMEYKEKIINTSEKFNSFMNDYIEYATFISEYNNELVIEYQIDIVCNSFSECSLWYRYFKQKVEQVIGCKLTEVMKVKCEKL